MLSLILSVCLFTQAPQEKVKFYSFHADWCGPCVRMERTTFKNKTIIKKIDKDFDFESIDVDLDRKLVKKYNIKAYPTQVFVYKNQVIHRIVGYRNANELYKELDKVLKLKEE